MNEIEEGAESDSRVSQRHANPTRYMYMFVFDVIRMYLRYQMYGRGTRKVNEICNIFHIHKNRFGYNVSKINYRT